MAEREFWLISEQQRVETDERLKTQIKEHQGQSSTGWFSNIFNTHLPIAERVKKLREMNL